MAGTSGAKPFREIVRETVTPGKVRDALTPQDERCLLLARGASQCRRKDSPILQFLASAQGGGVGY
jgi:hypothetical protein